MNEVNVAQLAGLRKKAMGLIEVETVVFGLAALAHAGVPIGIREPQLLPAMIVEGLITFVLGLTAVAFAAKRTWGWSAAVIAHLLAAVGVLLGLWAQRDGGGSHANRVYHLVMLVVVLTVLWSLMLPSVRDALSQRRCQA